MLVIYCDLHFLNATCFMALITSILTIDGELITSHFSTALSLIIHCCKQYFVIRRESQLAKVHIDIEFGVSGVGHDFPDVAIGSIMSCSIHSEIISNSYSVEVYLLVEKEVSLSNIISNTPTVHLSIYSTCH